MRNGGLSLCLDGIFLATDPDEASGLSYEEEEALILEATEQLGMELRVEESGCVVELKSFGGGLLIDVATFLPEK
jgi:hypothetical protein